MRNAGRLKLGYYPLPPAEGEKIRELLQFPASETMCALDPCAGTGAALLQVTKGARAALYAVELDSNRAAAAKAAGIETIHGGFFDVQAKVEQFSLLYLNPPYDMELGPFDNKRMEYVFLDSSFRLLRNGGVLVFVIPEKRLEACSRTLASHFTDLRVFKLMDPESVRFNQIVVFGTRKQVRGKAVEQNFNLLSTYTRRWATMPVPPLESGPVEYPYIVPPSGRAHLEYRGIPFDEVEDLLPTSSAWKQVGLHVLPEDEISGGRPITPLHGGHVALLCAAGLMNGVFGTGKQRHIAKWRSVKHIKKVEEADAENKDVTIVRYKERIASELMLIFENGRRQFLTPNAQREGDTEDAKCTT